MGKWNFFTDWKGIFLLSIVAIVFACSMCKGQVTAADFNAGQTISAKDFLVLADGWDNRAKAADQVASNPTARGDEFNYALGEKHAYERCSEELKALVDRKQMADAKTETEADLFADAKNGDWQAVNKDALFVQQIEQQFNADPRSQTGQEQSQSNVTPVQNGYPAPPKGLGGPPTPPVYPQPLQAPKSPQQAKVAPQVQVQYHAQSCNLQPVQYNQCASRSYGQPYNQGWSSGGGGRFRIFQNWRARRQARQASRGGMFSGCG